MYDELGHVNPPEYADIQLMEDIDTGQLPSGPGPDVEPLDA